MTEQIETPTGALVWKVHTPGLLKEILNNPGTGILTQPLRIFSDILAEVAQRAIELKDRELMALMCRLALFEESDPYSAKSDLKKCNDLINSVYNKPKKRARKNAK